MSDNALMALDSMFLAAYYEPDDNSSPEDRSNGQRRYVKDTHYLS
ncbi:hypothetical protein [Psychrobacter coccoides]|nr:hypothetical protein [Psychrobacter coccoides]